MINNAHRDVKSDRHGKFVEYGGRIFRPVFPKPYTVFEIKTKHSIHSTVTVRITADSPLAVIGGETWFSHGSDGWKPDFWEW